MSCRNRMHGALGSVSINTITMFVLRFLDWRSIFGRFSQLTSEVRGEKSPERPWFWYSWPSPVLLKTLSTFWKLTKYLRAWSFQWCLADITRNPLLCGFQRTSKMAITSKVLTLKPISLRPRGAIALTATLASSEVSNSCQELPTVVSRVDLSGFFLRFGRVRLNFASGIETYAMSTSKGPTPSPKKCRA